MKGAELRYTTTEFLAVVFGLGKYRHILYGERFAVVTDYIALKWLISLRKPKDRLSRWMMAVMLFAFDVEYSTWDCTLMRVPDALSRDKMEMDRDLLLCPNFLGSVETEVVQRAAEEGEVKSDAAP
jgi:hypothetical protein